MYLDLILRMAEIALGSVLMNECYSKLASCSPRC